ncbi:MAG TPA: cytochrome c3 family protein [Vicinamibacteria bacterium]
MWVLPMLGLGLSAWAAAATKPPKIHPRLVSAASTKCTGCHAPLFQGKANVHPPAREDCTACHEVQSSEAGTTVTLTTAGPALCLGCHDGLAAAAAGRLKTPHAPVADSCTSCHDPHASAVPRLLTTRPSELCAACHEVAGLQTPHRGQLAASASCVACHSPHGSAYPKMLAGAVLHAPFADKSCEACHRPPMGGRTRLKGRADVLCASCHGDVPTSAPPGGSWHPALEGSRTASGCLTCHDPHLSPNRKLLVKTGTALCVSCHGEVARAAGAKGGHAPAADDCLSCHKPHAAPGPSLLAEAPRAVCLGCHDAADAGLRKAHLGAKVEGLDCTSCHSPHGAGHAKALARYVHAPLTEGCDACHQGSASKLLEDGGPPLCLTCHEEVGTKAKSAKVRHAAMDAARCVDCHNPHASPRQRLVKEAGGAGCLACHSDQAPGAGEQSHGAIGLVGCEACHEPHGGARPKLLRGVGNGLCLGCHRASGARLPAEGMVPLAGRFEVPAAAAQAIRTVLLSPDGSRGHPTRDHLVVALPPAPSAAGPRSTFKGELSCLACHDPHKGKSAHLLRWGAVSAADACLNCHRK